MPVPPPPRRVVAPVQRPVPLVIDQDTPALAVPELVTNLPAPAPSEDPPDYPLTTSDAAWEGEATQSKVRLLLIAGGMVGAAVVGLLLTLALTSGGPAQKGQRPRGPAEEVARQPARRDPWDVPRAERPEPAGRKGGGIASEEAGADDTRPESPPVLTSPGTLQQPSTGKTPPPEPLPPVPDKPIDRPPPGSSLGGDKPANSQPTEDDKALVQVTGLLKQLDASLPTETRMAALEALGKLGPKVKDTAGKPVARCMLDHNPKIGRKALDALEKIDPAVAKECTDILVDNELRLKSIETLARLGRDAKSATPILVGVVDKVIASRGVGLNVQKPFDVAAAAVRALVVIAPDDERLPRHFVAWIEVADEGVKVAAVSGLPRLERLSQKDKHDAVLGLSKQLKVADSPRVKTAAADALGEFGPDAKAAVGALENAKVDKNAEVRQSAQRALDKIRGER